MGNPGLLKLQIFQFSILSRSFCINRCTYFRGDIFRYYIFGGLLKKYKLSTAIFFSSALFALIHISDLNSFRNLIPPFVFGIVSCLVYFRTKKVINSIILHFLSNAFWFTTVVFAKDYNELIKGLGYGLLFWIVFLTGILLLVVGLRKMTTDNVALTQRQRSAV